ncbi:MAG: sigma-70 family RNA polymerase sigma factor [Planctomycetes bacterium]|nr:sigma-70 family RNA polymerase sigma factor [Planctomycetota bacterium]
MEETKHQQSDLSKAEVRLPPVLSSPPLMAPLVSTSAPLAFADAGFTGASGAHGNPAVELLTREEGALRRIIQRYVRDAATVDDVYQEVSIKVLKRIDSVRDPAALRGWLFQLARNACLDYLRREDRRKGLSHDVLAEHTASGDLGRNPSEQFLSRERVTAVRRALDQLPASQREVLVLRIDEGLDHEAIAERLRISRQAVEVRLCRGRAALKDQLEDIMRGAL